MKVHCLSQSPQSPCYLLEYKNVKILLDCALEISSILHFLPKNLNYNDNNNNNNSSGTTTTTTTTTQYKEKEKELNEFFKNISGTLYIDNGCSNIKYNCPQFEMINDFSTVDFILISNYTNIYSLPFITEYTNFKGKIYATEPTVQIGRLLLEELVQMDKQYSNSSGTNSSNLTDGWQNKEVLNKIGAHNVGIENENLYRDAYRWKDLYKKIDIEKSFEKIQTVRFCETINFYGLECTASSSGFGLGSSNWAIDSKGYERVVYMSDSSLSVSRYPAQFEIAPIDQPDVLILSKLNHYPNNPPDEMLTELCSSIGSTLQQGGTVLIPSYSCGIILDLFEHLSDYLTKLGLPFVPIYFISSVSKAVLSYADIYSEWLNKTKQDRAFMPETPFLHQDLMKKGQFQAYQHVHSNFQSNDPSIIFTGHPSCRIGDITTLIKLYGDNPKNSILLIEPDFDFKSTVLPFSKQISRIKFLPIDPRINFNEANLLIAKLSPKNLIIPHVYKNYIKNKHLNGNTGMITTILPLDIIKIQNQQKFEHGYLDKELAQTIQTKIVEKPTPLNRNTNITNTNTTSQIHVAEITGVLSMNDHELIISPPNINDSNKIIHIKEKFIWGTLSIQNIIKQINNSKLVFSNNNSTTNIEYFEINENYFLIKITNNSNNEITNVHLSPNNVNIETNCESTRKLISDIILLNCNGLYI